MLVAGGLSGFLSRRCRGLRSCVESVPKPEHSSPVLTWILEYFWSLPGESVLVSSGGMHVRSRAVAGVSRFPSCGSRVQGFTSRLSHEAFPRGFPTGLSHVPPLYESILGLKVEAVQGKLVSLAWTEHLGDSGNGGTTLEFLSLFLWRVPPLEMRRERQEYLPDHVWKGSLLWNYEAETGLLWMWAGRS